MNRFQQRAALVPRTVTWSIAAPLIALAAYQWASYAGLYRLLAEMQLQSFQQYYPTYTGIITIILCLIPGIVAIQIIGAQREKERSPAEAAEQVARYAESRARHSTWIQSRRRRLTGLLVTAMLAGAGIYFTALGLIAGDRVSVDAGAIEGGEQPAGRWAEVTGRLLGEDAVSVAERGSKSTAHAYVPLVSPEWRPGQPVRLYLKIYASWLETRADLESGHFEGMLGANDLPGVAITSLAEDGHPAPDRYWVLEYRETPQKKMELGYAMFGGAGIIGLVTAIAWLIVARRASARGHFGV